MHNLEIAESEVIDFILGEREDISLNPLFILGAPRTGSTLFYQSICSNFKLPFISNFSNRFFSETPILGFYIQKTATVKINFDSDYGKTKGGFQPSEGSAVMSHWFGGAHPSALASSRILNDGKERHFLNTLRSVEALFEAPIVIKNAWNCYRIQYLANVLPNARFIWICRDIAAAAKSDLAARYKTKGSADVWNSATPANWHELRKLSPVAQVVENQHEMNLAVDRDLCRYAEGRWLKVWYEDFIEDPDATMRKVGSFLGRPFISDQGIEIIASKGWDLSEIECQKIDDYVQYSYEKFANHRYELRI